MQVYSKEQLAAMSDLEINKALATLLLDMQGAPYKFVETVPSAFEALRGADLSNVISVVCGFGFRLDYCNDWNHVMNLAVEYRIRISPYMDIWCADFIATGQSYFDKNPLRAIACCLILVLQAAARLG